MCDALDKSGQVANYRQYADLLGLGYDVTSKKQARFPAYAEPLGKGIGHYVGTATPGMVGNFATAGHRTTSCSPSSCRSSRGRTVCRRP